MCVFEHQVKVSSSPANSKGGVDGLAWPTTWWDRFAQGLRGIRIRLIGVGPGSSLPMLSREFAIRLLRLSPRSLEGVSPALRACPHPQSSASGPHNRSCCACPIRVVAMAFYAPMETKGKGKAMSMGWTSVWSRHYNRGGP